MARSIWRRWLIGELSWARLGRSLVLIYLVFALYVYLRADSMIFLPQPASYTDTEEILKIAVTDRERISALYLPNPTARYTLLYSHGNAEDLGDIRPVLERLHRWGFSVLAYDYRGYGTSDGRPSAANAYADIEAAYNYLTGALGKAPAQILPYGRSVGSGPSTALATDHPVAGLILESAFTSVFRVVVPFPLLPFDRFPNLDRLPRLGSPVLVMHGYADQVIPIHHGKTLYEAALTPKQSLWVDTAGHNDFTWVAGDRHRQALLAFEGLISSLPGPNP
ncbi:alpha/beta hydrolase [Leptolyngbya sp. KIOST-1]|uniref:alpha/beta hydrolase n=1 Tax=Leptolyngbya sp. KIOST-1 TaxID=1229172 RepID=UPI00055F7B42|nr:alpha/beta hydrolase [Leptolyngbya sp. KIOST-1]